MFKKFFKKEIHFIDFNNDSIFSYRLKGNILSISHLIDGIKSDTRTIRASLIKQLRVRLYYVIHFKDWHNTII